MERSRGEHRNHWRLGNWKIQFYQLNTRVSIIKTDSYTANEMGFIDLECMYRCIVLIISLNQLKLQIVYSG